MEESILLSISKLIGFSPDYPVFDLDLKIHINSVFSALTQIGVGPKEGFRITGANETWSDFIGTERIDLELVKEYVYLRVRKFFDPPTSSFVLEAINSEIKEAEFRLFVACDPKEEVESEEEDDE